MLTKGGVGGSKGTPKRTNFRPVSCELSFEYCFIQISSYSRAYVRMIYENITGQIALRPSLRKQNIQAKEVDRPSRVFQISSPVHFATALGSRPSALRNWRKKFSLPAQTNGPTQ